MIKIIKRMKWTLCYLPVLYKRYKNKTDSNIVYILFNFIYYKLLYDKHIIAHSKVKIKGINNLILKGSLEIGVNEFGILSDCDITLLNLKGKFFINSSHYSIGRGCRISVEKDGKIVIGEGGHITGLTKFIISHKLIIGDDCAISWECQFLDSDHQRIKYKNVNYQSKNNGIIIGNHVWIGTGSMILKGSVISDGCVIGSNSLVNKNFEKLNSLIGGIPAKVIRSNILWE